MGSRSQSVKRWWEHRKELWDVSPGELVALQKSGAISESLKGYAALAMEESFALVTALGGESEVSTQRMLLIQDVARLGLVLRAVMGKFIQGDGDPELASRVATITSARRASLQALGLERHEREVSLESYIAAAEDHSGATISTDPDSVSASALVDVPAVDEGGARVKPDKSDAQPPGHRPQPTPGDSMHPMKGDGNDDNGQGDSLPLE